MSMWKHVAGGLAMGLGQGMVEQAKQTGQMKRDAALARMRSQERMQDRAWSIEDQQAAAQAAAQASERERALTLEDRADERAYEAQKDETDFERKERLARLEASLRGPTNPTASNLYDTVVNEEGELVGIRRDGTKVPLGIKPKDGLKADDAPAYVQEVEYLAKVLADGEEVTAQHRKDAAEMRRSGAESDTKSKEKARDVLFTAIMEGQRSTEKDPVAAWDQATEMAGLGDEATGSVVTPGGLGGGDAGPTEAAAGSPSPGPSDAGAGMPAPKSAEEYAALPSGTAYMAPDGTVRTKP